MTQDADGVASERFEQQLHEKHRIIAAFIATARSLGWVAGKRLTTWETETLTVVIEAPTGILSWAVEPSYAEPYADLPWIELPLRDGDLPDDRVHRTQRLASLRAVLAEPLSDGELSGGKLRIAERFLKNIRERGNLMHKWRQEAFDAAVQLLPAFYAEVHRLRGLVRLQREMIRELEQKNAELAEKYGHKEPWESES